MSGPSTLTRDAIVARLARLDTCAISDALDRLGLAGIVSGLPPRGAVRRVAGCVVTVKLGPGEPPAGRPRHLCAGAIDAARPGDVIVVEHRSGVECGGWGGLLSLGAKLRGVAGAIVDGHARDVDESRGLDFAVFARHVTARTARGRIVELADQVPVMIGDVRVSPGDYVVADGSAVAFIGSADATRVLAAAEDLARRETVMARALLGGARVSDVMGASYERLLKER